MGAAAVSLEAAPIPELWESFVGDDPHAEEAWIVLSKRSNELTAEDVLPELVDILTGDESPDRRRMAACLVGELGSRSVSAWLPDLERVLTEDTDPAVREEVAKSIGKCDLRAAERAPLMAMDDPAARVRGAAHWALGVVATDYPMVTRRLIRARATEPDRAAKLYALDGLNRISRRYPEANLLIMDAVAQEQASGGWDGMRPPGPSQGPPPAWLEDGDASGMTRLQRVLDKLGKSQAWLARESGFSVRQINHYCRGTAAPKIGGAAIISEVLGLPISDLWDLRAEADSMRASMARMREAQAGDD